MSEWLTLLGTTSIQSYIFRSNKLKENIGASYRVLDALEVQQTADEKAAATTDQGLEARLGKAGFKVTSRAWRAYQESIKQKRDPKEAKAQAKGLEGRDVEILYTGGGNAALRCKDKTTAFDVVKRWSRALLEDAPGLRVSAAHAEIEAKGGLQEAYERALEEIGRFEEAPPWGAMYQAQPIFQTCKSTGMAANVLRHAQDQDEDKEALSGEADAKRQVVTKKGGEGPARKRWNDDFADILDFREDGGPFDFPFELDDLGTVEGESHLALIHADGNGIGKLLVEVAEKKGRSEEDFLHDLRSFSASVGGVAFGALKRVLEKARGSLRWWQEAKGGGMELKPTLFPILPLVYGGDDLTLVCHGKTGLSVAVELLREFEKEAIWVCGAKKKISACAGVLIMPKKYPFARAYEMCEELCSSAKAARTKRGKEAEAEKKGSEASVGGYLDFHVIMGSSVGSVEEIREERYQAPGGEELDLCYRPWAVKKDLAGGKGVYDWGDFLAMVEAFRGWPRSRAKGLLLALSRGEEETKAFLKQAEHRQYDLPLKMKEGDVWAEKSGKDGKKAVVFDALELMEFVVGWEEKAAASGEEGKKK